MAVNTRNMSPQIIEGTARIELADVESATVIKAGDFVCHKDNSTNARYAVPPSGIADAGNATNNREAVADLFWGVALDASASGSTTPIRVAGVGTQLYLKLQTAAAATSQALYEIYCEDPNTGTPNNTIVAGTTSQIAVCIKSKADATDPWVLCQILPDKLRDAMKQT